MRSSGGNVVSVCLEGDDFLRVLETSSVGLLSVCWFFYVYRSVEIVECNRFL